MRQVARLNPRRRERKAGKGLAVIANLSSPKARDGRLDAKAPSIGHAYLFANATAQPPQGTAFTARFVLPKVKRYARFSRA